MEALWNGISKPALANSRTKSREEGVTKRESAYGLSVLGHGSQVFQFGEV